MLLCSKSVIRRIPRLHQSIILLLHELVFRILDLLYDLFACQDQSWSEAAHPLLLAW